MNEKSELWRFIEPAVKALGVEIFDIEAPRSWSGALKIYIYRPKADRGEGQESGVNISDCARLSKDILSMDGITRFISDETTLEVSSPGINRKLRRPEHFQEAVGERVRINYLDAPGAKAVTLGVLTNFSGDNLTVDDERRREPVSVSLNQISEARVDFLFGN